MEENAIDELVRMEGEFMDAHGGQEPRIIHLGRELRKKIYRLRPDQINPVADKILRDGIKAVPTIHGMKVVPASGPDSWLE
jgi:hypothetical protein